MPVQTPARSCCAVTVAAVAALGILYASPSEARWREHVYFGVGFPPVYINPPIYRGPPVYWSQPYWAPYPEYWAPPVYAPPAIAPPPPAQSAPPQTWYFCDRPQGYYPYVQQCDAVWRQVPATPTR